MLIISYESLSLYFELLLESCNLLICDEGHKLKNDNTKLYQILLKIKCTKRIIISGTPIQNNLEELYNCFNFINPGMFKQKDNFFNVYINPIMKSK